MTAQTPGGATITGQRARAFVLLTAMLFTGGLAQGAEHRGLVIRGNRLFPDEVYLTMLGEDGGGWIGGVVSPDRARAAAAHLERFLLRSGYELATVVGRVEDGRMILDIDEGSVAKVAFHGRGTATSVQLRLLLDTPHQIFNRPQLQRQLAAIKERYGIDATWELVPVNEVEHSGFQLEDVEFIQGMPTLGRSGDYELHISLERNEWGPGKALHASYKGEEGVRLGLSYRGRSMVGEQDRWGVRGDVAVRSFERLGSDDVRVEISRAIVEARWFTSPLRWNLRPFLWLYGDLKTRQRADLGIETYRWFEGGALLNLGYEFTPAILASYGIGAEYRYLFDVRQPGLPAFGTRYEDDGQRRLISNLRLEIDFEPKALRLDRRHQLDLNLRAFFANRLRELNRNARLWQVDGSYQKIFPFGWNELWITSVGAAVFGDSVFADEHSLNDFIRGVFGTTYVPRAFAMGGELRFSLSRDVYRLGIYLDLAGFRRRDVLGINGALGLAGAIGAGFHALILDVAQLDLYYGLGYSLDEGMDAGLSARLSKAF